MAIAAAGRAHDEKEPALLLTRRSRRDSLADPSSLPAPLVWCHAATSFPG